MIRRTKWFWLSATFPLSCPLSPYLQLLEVLLLHLLLCYNVRLVLNLVYLLRGAVRLNLRHYPGDRRLESRYHNLRGKLRRYLQLLASRQTLLSVGKPACQQATLLCLAGQSRYRGKKKKGREIQQNEGWWQTTCYSRWLWWNITIELNEPMQEVSENKPRDNGYRFSYLKKTKACLFKFGGSALSWRPEARVGVKKKKWKIELRSRSDGRSWVHKNQIAPLPLHCYKGAALLHAKDGCTLHNGAHGARRWTECRLWERSIHGYW